MKYIITTIALLLILTLSGCMDDQDREDSRAADRQQSTYASTQPVPAYDWSLERHLAIQSYNIRNKQVATHTVWRSITGMIEGDCPSMGFTLPYDTSLTNPLKLASNSYKASIIEQAEPNGIFLSKNSNATWVFCINDIGSINPVLIETNVTTYPYAVTVDYDTNRVTQAGKASVTISKQ